MKAPARSAIVASPVKGWNTVDALDNMPRGFAVVLDNFFPAPSACELRGGYVEHCDTGTGANVDSLMEWTGAAPKLIAASDGELWDVSTSTPASLASGFVSDTWESTMFSTAAGQFLLMANGVDPEQKFDGTVVTAIGNTGPTARTHSPCAFAQRMFYAETGTLKVWYSTAGAFAGTPLTAYDLGQFCERGGEIATLSTWTKDNAYTGSTNDMFVVATTKGETLIFSGTNPGDPANWGLIGRYLLGAPVSGHRSAARLGPDMLILCEDGFQPLSHYLAAGDIGSAEANLARNIAPAVSEAVRLGRDRDGWGVLVYPGGTAVYVNVPVSATVFHQYVVNTTTGAWCRYKGIPARCWSLFDNSPYFGRSNGKVYRQDTGASDGGSDIQGEMITAFDTLRAPAVVKNFTLARPHLLTNGPLAFSLGLAFDYDASGILNTINSNPNSQSLWDSALWDSALWGNDTLTVQAAATGVGGVGYAVAVHFKVATHTVAMKVNGFDLVYERGGFL